MKTFAQNVIQFNKNLGLSINVPGVEVLNPFLTKSALDISAAFYNKYYNDSNPRTFLFGINPGRFGAGVTGIPFTDPINLENHCGIQNSLDKKPELSSQFIYQMIEALGGADEFYSRFFVTAVSPLGFTKDGNNLNYYDIKELQQSLKPFIISTIKKQLDFGANTKCAICIGGGKNFKYFNELNKQHHFFDFILPLDHPRFIMQYRRKKLDGYVEKYLDALGKCEALNRG
ncbi:MAG: DUF4918 domain-containing protein [Bacteroidetes bacterium 4484_276]|nr:MAG: DUF4918 domain-containing protein [Bacteroidetes bacterium 4484_276]